MWDANDAFTERAPLVEANMAYSRTEADVMGVPLWYGEFGMRRSAPGADATLTQIYEIADAHLAGASVWEYARNECGVLRADGSLDPARSATVARPYPTAVAGRLVSFGFTDGVFRMEWESGGAGQTLVALPVVAFPDGFDVSLTAGATVSSQSPGSVTITAPPGPHALTVTPR